MIPFVLIGMSKEGDTVTAVGLLLTLVMLVFLIGRDMWRDWRKG